MNIMKVNYLFGVAAIAALMIACAQKDSAKSSRGFVAGSDEEQVRHDIIEFFERMREGDKTVLYEHEHEYYKVEHSLNEYYTFEQIMVYQYDTMKAITVDSVSITADTAIAYIRIQYELRSGGETTQGYPVRMYREGGRWIKPSLSYYKLQAEYEAFKAGEREAEEYDDSGGN